MIQQERELFNKKFYFFIYPVAHIHLSHCLHHIKKKKRLQRRVSHNDSTCFIARGRSICVCVVATPLIIHAYNAPSRRCFTSVFIGYANVSMLSQQNLHFFLFLFFVICILVRFCLLFLKVTPRNWIWMDCYILEVLVHHLHHLQYHRYCGLEVWGKDLLVVWGILLLMDSKLILLVMLSNKILVSFFFLYCGSWRM